MKILRLRNTNLQVVDGDLTTSINIYNVTTSIFTDEGGQEFININNEVLLSANLVQDEEGNTLATNNDIVDYIHTLQNTVVELGGAIRLDNIELRSTGEEILQINTNTNRKTLNVFQEISSTGTERVFFRNQDPNEFVSEDSSSAFNPVSIHTGTSIINAQNRYVISLDILVSGSKFVQGYRSKSQTGIINGNIKVFNITQAPHDLNKYRELSAVDISAGWYISKRPHWSYRKESEIDNKAGFELGSGDIELPLAEGFELLDGEVYRFVISADNEFTMDGYNAGSLVTGVEGSTQFVPYLERTFFGQVDTLVRTHGALNLSNIEVDFRRDHTDTTILVNAGAGYNFSVNALTAYEDNGTISIASIDGGTAEFNNISHLLVKIGGNSAGTTISGVVNALNSLFSVTPLGLGGDYISSLPTLDGVDITANFAEGQTPITGDLYGVDTDTSQHGARIWSTETIDESNEYYEVKITGKGQFMLGLYSVTDGDLTEITNNIGNGHSGYKWANAFYNYGSYIAPWTWYGSSSSGSYGPGWTGSGNTPMMRYKSIIQDNFANGNPVLFKVGIGANGHIEVYYFDEGVTNTWIMTSRTSYTLPTGQYGLLVKLVNGTVRLVETPKRVATDPTAPTLTYYFAESPDTNFLYPLFTTEEEANYYDSQNGGAGSSFQHLIADDAVPGRLWFIPTNGSEMNGVSQPSNTTEITYNEIQTQDDGLFRPSLFSSTTFTVNEGDAINIQLHPQDANFTTSIGTIPAFSLVNGYLVGTAPAVSGDNVTNPYDEYTVTVYRTNAFGTSPNTTELQNGYGVLTIRIMNLTAPVITPITGFTHDATTTALVDADTLNDGSLVNMDETLDDNRRLVILKSYVEANILPNIQSAGSKYYIGSLNSAADVTSLDDSDFDFAFVFEYQTANSHKFRMIRDGVQIHSVGIGSYTNAVYDYAIELQGTSAWLIACNVNSINTEPSPALGGSFSHAYEIPTIDATAPITISFAAKGTTADIDTNGLSEIVVPQPVITIDTNWNKAIDFSGSNQYAYKNQDSNINSPLRMNSIGATVAAPSDMSKTSNASNSRAWFVSCVFKSDRHNSNQHIWNYGEGSGSNDDNIYLRQDASGNVYFGWGRDSGRNECKVLSNISSNVWYAVYIAHKGTRLSANNASAIQLTNAFDIEIMSSSDGFTALTGGNNSSAWNSTGGRMDRAITGVFSIGGRSANRSFHGKVASCIVSTLKANTALPDDTEKKLIITDPIKWWNDYMKGNTGRRPDAYGTTHTNAYNSLNSARSTQIWLMGDGVSDSYALLRNRVYPSEQNESSLRMQSMVSNDIETVNINGLT